MEQYGDRACVRTRTGFSLVSICETWLAGSFSPNNFVFVEKQSIFAILFNPKKPTSTMKQGIHPENYRLVAFKDMSNDQVFLTRSAVQTRETIEVNGETYPVYKMEISSASHPFYTGKMKLVDTAGRVDKFMSRYQKHYDKRNAK